MAIYASTTYVNQHIISAVANVLREERTTVTNIESAVDKAGIDRNEVRARFGSMHGLILEMVSELSDSLIEPLEYNGEDRQVHDVLIEFANRLADTYSASHLIALYRIALTEAIRHSGIGRDFFERGPGKLTVCLAQYLESSARRSNQLPIDNPKRVAENFLSLLRDNLELFDALNGTRTSSAKDHSDAVTDAIELFCHGIVTEGQ